jgi:hypothetical protein
MSLVQPHGGERTEEPLPEFRMPTCCVGNWRSKHFFTGHRWWCKYCRQALREQAEQIAIALWSAQRTLKRIASAEDTSADVLREIAREELP